MTSKYLGSWYIIDQLNKHKATSGIYVFLKKHIKKGDFKIQSLPKPRPVRDNDTRKRVTIILPSLRKSKVFGGISTALNFFNQIIEKGNLEGRIIVIGNESFDSNLTVSVADYVKKNVKVHFIADNSNINVSSNDYFIFTTWKSAYIFNSIVNWQEKTYSKYYKSIYLIQDYEPGFVPWSTEFALAESTYRTNANRIIAVFNSKQLFDYFKFNNYKFKKEYYFQPHLNKKLKEELGTTKSSDREKLIIVYGRPNEPRNAFELLTASLAVWSEKYEDAKNWRILSIGAPNSNIKLSHNIIECKGKLTLQEYANIMLKAYAGISLMISPHPSYPPLEMSTFGVKTITNDFMNKQLNDFNKNLYSVAICNPEVIAKQLISICESYNGKGNIDKNKDYLDGNDFDKVISSVLKDI